MEVKPEYLEVLQKQFCIDFNCKLEDFCCTENVIVYSKENNLARKYLKLPHVCNLISYGNNIVATITSKYESIVKEYISKYSMEHCFETPNMHIINDAFQNDGCRVCFMAEYFLPDIQILQPLDCNYELRILTQKRFYRFVYKRVE